MINKSIERDERTTFVENTSYSFGYKILTFGLLFDIMYRSFRHNEAPWDLFALIFISGLAMTVYQYKQKILGKGILKAVVLTFFIAAAAAATVVLLK